MSTLSPFNEEIPNPATQPTNIAIQVLIIYLIRIRSDQAIDGMNDAIDAIRMENAAPRVP